MAPNGAITFISIPCSPRIFCISNTSSRQRNPSKDGPRRFTRGRRLSFFHDVGICSITKDLPTNLCEVESEIFIKDTEPTKVCKVHRRN